MTGEELIELGFNKIDHGLCYAYVRNIDKYIIRIFEYDDSPEYFLVNIWEHDICRYMVSVNKKDLILTENILNL